MKMKSRKKEKSSLKKVKNSPTIQTAFLRNQTKNQKKPFYQKLHKGFQMTLETIWMRNHLRSNKGTTSFATFGVRPRLTTFHRGQMEGNSGLLGLNCTHGWHILRSLMARFVSTASFLLEKAAVCTTLIS